MQTLFFKKKKLEKKNNQLINTFFINMFLITLLSFNIIPFISIEVLISVIVFLTITEGIIVKKVKNNEETIKKINSQIDYLTQGKKDDNFVEKEIINDYNEILIENNINNYLNNERNIVKIKKKNL